MYNQLATYVVTNLELTSSRLLSLLSLNSYTSIAGAITPRMLSKQRIPHTIHIKTTFFSNHSVRIACTEDFFKCMEMSIAPRRKRYFIRSLPVSILLRELALPHSPTVFHRSIGTRHPFFLLVDSLLKHY